MRALPLLLALPFLASCAAGAPADDPGDDRAAAELDALYDRFSAAYGELDLDALAALYTDDALYLPPEGGIREGRDAVRASFSSFFDWAREQSVAVEVTFDVVDRTVRDDLAVDVGYYSLTTTPAAGSGQEPGRSVGKFVTVSERGDDGAWRFRTDAYNLAPLEAFVPPPSPVAAHAEEDRGGAAAENP